MIRRPPAGGLFCVRWGRVFSFLSPTGCFLFWRKKGVPRLRVRGVSGGLLLSVATKVTKSAIQGGRKFRSSFPLENPPSLNDQRRRAAALPLWKYPPKGRAIIKSRLCRAAAKVGGGLWPLFEKRSCHKPRGCTALHFRTKAAAKREAETMQHLGEISEVQRSRGRDGQDKRRVKPRKGFSNRRFERRFWVLLPPRAKVPRAGARNVPLV